VAGVEVKSLDQPDETRSFSGKGEGRVYDVGGHAVIYGTFEPGWRWSEHIKPMAGTDSCQAPHLLYCISGRMHVAHNDGTEAEIGPGDLAVIEPGHDAWIVGDEACVSVDFGGYGQYAAAQS
jgi:quercetin dioxygenase-like cupin family protein